MRAVTVAIAVMLTLGGCVTVMQGDEQKLTFESTPPVAQCTVSRDGAVLATVVTPGTATVTKSPHPLTVVCTKPGFEDAQGTFEPSLDKFGASNILNGGIGVGIDAWTGVMRKYDSTIRIAMAPKPGGVIPAGAYLPLRPAVSSEMGRSHSACAAWSTGIEGGPVCSKWR